eukprot:14574425-Alexandrium_andersonii.AAC.1
MSASLVGSEMCIRDSLPTDAPDPSVPASLSSSCKHVPPSPLCPPVRGGTVSYTHLTLPTICSV